MNEKKETPTKHNFRKMRYQIDEFDSPSKFYTLSNRPISSDNKVQIQKIRDEDEIVNTNYTGKEEMNTQRTNITSNLDKESINSKCKEVQRGLRKMQSHETLLSEYENGDNQACNDIIKNLKQSCDRYDSLDSNENKSSRFNRSDQKFCNF